MNPSNPISVDLESVTIRQIIRAMQPSHLIAVVSALAAIAIVSFSAGSMFAANSSDRDLATAQSERDRLDAKLSIEEGKLAHSREAIASLVRDKDELQKHALSQTLQITALTRQVGINSTGKFVQSQIESLQAQVESIRVSPAFRTILQGSQASVLSPDEKESIVNIEQRIAGFQRQLAGCAGQD